MSSISNYCDQNNAVSNSNNNDVECCRIETFNKKKTENGIFHTSNLEEEEENDGGSRVTNNARRRGIVTGKH